MAMSARGAAVASILKGVLAAALLTLLGMAILAALVVFAPIPDGTLLCLNQILKVAAIAVGALCAVGWGGSRGFVMGAVVGALYMLLGYALYCLLDGTLAPARQIAGELLMGAAIGALAGMVLAQCKPRKKRAPRPRRERRRR